MGRKTKQNKITSPELIAQINPKNIRLMNDFLDYLRSVGKAESTVKAYTSDLYKTGCCGTTKTHLRVCAG